MTSRKILSFFSMLLLAQTAGAGKGDQIPGPAICASQEAFECAPIAGCKRVSLEDIDGPLFISLKPGDSHLLVNLTNGKLETAQIERREKLDGKFFFQGAEDAKADSDDAVGWTLQITEETGYMVVTFTGSEAAFTVFGACTLL